MLEYINQLSYCQLKNTEGFYKNLELVFSKEPKLVKAVCNSSEQIYDVIKEFFKKGN